MKKPDKLYHVTTVKKYKRYKHSGHIKKPVRGFTTLIAAMAWAIKIGRQIIVEIDLSSINPDNIHKMPDHHNKWGEAWWVDEDISFNMLKVVYNPSDA